MLFDAETMVLVTDAETHLMVLVTRYSCEVFFPDCEEYLLRSELEMMGCLIVAVVVPKYLLPVRRVFDQ